ncbi:hypothetical protein ILUMI_08724 [Ignelater luminosus]|uniref:Retrotransposon Copia-like N-terminal domain-containing protein n=1 Tax=Ignelater luminosus TaxID=2038154 RepID=A0A8K0GAD3_IGNLU|nr:hypothetical protein ILUMI_08724 [Ignelater luminosus]
MTTTSILLPITVSSVPNIETLEGQSNYGSWRFAMTMRLMLEGVWSTIEGTLNETKRENDNRALAKICLTIKP